MATATDPETQHDEHHNEFHELPFSAHHFDNAEQQFDSGKLGMWLFLITEVLFFSGLFCAYAVYRANHPEIFQYAHQFLDKYLGGLNTIVLIFSSLTMAWAVRAAQLGQQKNLITLLCVTLFCAALFLGVKTFEYTEKAHKRLLWAGASVNASELGKKWQAFELGEPLPAKTFEERVMESLGKTQRNWFLSYIIPIALILCGNYWLDSRPMRSVGLCFLISIVGIQIGIQSSIMIHNARHAGDHHGEDSHHAAADHADEEHAHGSDHEEHHAEAGADHDHKAESHEDEVVEDAHYVDVETSVGVEEKIDVVGHKDQLAPKNANIFFSIYYFMTGLHAFHIVGGMIAISWLIVRSFENHFRPDYFGPVDYVGLYWHLVDLIWIYLFPLLYLIGE